MDNLKTGGFDRFPDWYNKAVDVKNQDLSKREIFEKEVMGARFCDDTLGDIMCKIRLIDVSKGR